MPKQIWKYIPFFLFLNVFLSISSTLALNDQGQALLSWKYTLKGSLDVLKYWNIADATPCSWYGVKCNVDNEVVELNLRYVDLLGHVPNNVTSLKTLSNMILTGTNLTGSIPKELGISLTNLIHLDLSDNALTGEIPGEIGSLMNLERLLLNSNSIEGVIPVEIGNLLSIKWLVLYDNQISGTIPSSIGRLKTLEVIRFGGNKNLEGALPSEIGNCTSLVMLGLADTSISGFLPPSLGQLKKLETLALYTALISGQIPPELGDCTELQNIYLYENSITGSIPKQLGNLKNLKNFLIWQNNLVGVIPWELGNCGSLTVIDLSMNSITGSIPESFGNLTSLLELQLSINQISGRIPTELASCKGLTHIELDNNQISGTIPTEFGLLTNLTLLFLWQNKLEGNIPSTISQCYELEAVDLSQNGLTGQIPKGIFELQNLNKLLLLANNLSGDLPKEIGKCKSLIRFRANNNKITGSIPPEIGDLRNLNFLDLGSNRLIGVIPPEISTCRNLTFLDLHGNALAGNLPDNFNHLVSLQFLDLSDNAIEGTLNPNLGSLSSLTKLVLNKNRFSGPIPSQLGTCIKLQLLDLSRNIFTGDIPASIGQIPALEIALNLSMNKFSGHIPGDFSNLNKLGVLDLSHNELSGELEVIAKLQNIVSLNISFNNFSGRVPSTAFFTKLPLSDLTGNPSLCFSENRCAGGDSRHGGSGNRGKVARIVMVVLLCFASVLLLAALYIMVKGKNLPNKFDLAKEFDLGGGDEDLESGSPWEVMLYQKLDLSITDVARGLTIDNILGKGRSGVVYRVNILSGQTIAVKKFRPSEKDSASAFSSEIATLARIRHRNIVRLLGWGANSKAKLLFYDYLPNGTLGELLHDGRGGLVEWETRFKIVLGVAEGLSYLHHDCVPAILHRDVKAQNILLGERYEACLADFGLARLVEDGIGSSFTVNPQFAGSYGYMAPEYACMLKITEKSDVYSYGIVLLECITGKQPVDPSFPDGQHIIQWVRDHLKNKKDPVKILDSKLQGRPDSQIQEMLQALGISLLCASNRAEDRPTMKDVAALLREIQHEPIIGSDGFQSTSKSWKKLEETSCSASVSPMQLYLQGSSQSSLTYSSSSPVMSKEIKY